MAPGHHGRGAGARVALRVRQRVLARVEEGDAHLVIRGGAGGVEPADHNTTV